MLSTRWINQNGNNLQTLINLNFPYRIVFNAPENKVISSENVSLVFNGGLFHLVFEHAYANTGYTVFVQSHSRTPARVLNRSPNGFTVDPLGENGLWSIFGSGEINAS